MSRSKLTIYDTEPKRYHPQEDDGNPEVVRLIDWLVDLNFADVLYQPEADLLLHRLDAVYRQAGSGARQQTYYGVVRGSGGLLEVLSSGISTLFQRSRWEAIDPERAGSTDIPPQELIDIHRLDAGTPDQTVQDLRGLLQEADGPLSVTVSDRHAAHRVLNHLEGSAVTVLVGADLPETVSDGPVAVDLVVTYGDVESLTLSTATQAALDDYRDRQRDERIDEATTLAKNSVSNFARDDHHQIGLRLEVIAAVRDAVPTDTGAEHWLDDKHLRQAAESMIAQLQRADEMLESTAERRAVYEEVKTTAERELDTLKEQALTGASDTVRSTIDEQIRTVAPAFVSRRDARRQVLDAAIPEYRPGVRTVRGYTVPWPRGSLPDTVIGVVVGLVIGSLVAAALVALGVATIEPVTLPV